MPSIRATTSPSTYTPAAAPALRGAPRSLRVCAHAGGSERRGRPRRRSRSWIVRAAPSGQARTIGGVLVDAARSGHSRSSSSTMRPAYIALHVRRWVSVIGIASLGACGSGALTEPDASSGGADAGMGTDAAISDASCPARCEAMSTFCDVATDSCLACLAAADCASDETCRDGACVANDCERDVDCGGDSICTASGCAACVDDVVSGSGEGTVRGACFAARRPNGRDPTGDSDGCSAESVVTHLESIGFDVPSDDAGRRAIRNNPLAFITGGMCSVPFGNGGQRWGACELHDYCYSVCGSSRARCDSEFLGRLLDTCYAHYVTGSCLAACVGFATTYAGYVAINNEAAYLHNQGLGCSCCSGDTACGDGTCEVSVGETVDNCPADCHGDEPDGSDCITHNDCASNYCSLHGECTPSLCLTNGDCPSNRCNWGVCLARGLDVGATCSTDRACASGACSAGVCLECDSDDDCTAAEHCNLLGSCIPDLGNNAVCTAHGECLSGICSAGFCAECVRDSQCPAVEHCNLVGDCVADLGNNAVCTAHGECRSGICSAGFCAECIRDSQCPSSEHCNGSETASTIFRTCRPAPPTPSASRAAASASASRPPERRRRQGPGRAAPRAGAPRGRPFSATAGSWTLAVDGSWTS